MPVSYLRSHKGRGEAGDGSDAAGWLRFSRPLPISCSIWSINKHAKLRFDCGTVTVVACAGHCYPWCDRSVCGRSRRRALPLLSPSRANVAFDCTPLKTDILERVVVEPLKVANCLPDVGFVEPLSVCLPQRFGGKGRFRCLGGSRHCANASPSRCDCR